MKVDIRDVDDETIKDLFSPCRTCVYWEAPGSIGLTGNEAFALKKEWFEKTRGTFGSCGKMLYADGSPAAYAQYCPPHCLESAAAYAVLLPPGTDAILLSCLYVREGYRKRGLGIQILQAVMHDIKKRGYHAVETYARDDSSNNCSGPTAFYQTQGFSVFKKTPWDDAVFSHVRYELY